MLFGFFYVFLVQKEKKRISPENLKTYPAYDDGWVWVELGVEVIDTKHSCLTHQ